MTDADGSPGSQVDASSGDCPPAFAGSQESVFDQTSSRFELSAYATGLVFSGRAHDGQQVEFHQEADRRGICRLLTYDWTLCDPVCGTGTACVDGQCVSHPMAQAIGTLELTGFGNGITIAPTATGSYNWNSTAYSIADLSTVGLTGPGAVGYSFDLQACAPATPIADGDWVEQLSQRADGQDVTLRWSNPVSWARIYLRMTTGVATHGGISPVELECEGPDTGELTLPGPFLDALYEQGWACGECGGNDLHRYHSAESATGVQPIQFRVRSVFSFWFHPNLNFH